MINDKISVIVTTYNQKPYIKDCIDSILKQDIDEKFIIRIVDDFSQDGTKEMLIDYKAKFPERIYLYLNPINLGKKSMIPFANALEEIDTKYIAFCDGDDYWIDSGKLRKQCEILEKNPRIGIVHSDYLLGNSEVGQEVQTRRTEREITKANKMKYGRDLVQGNDIKHSTTVIRSEALDLDFILGARGVIALDWIIYVSVASRFEISYLSEATTVHRIHSAGVWNGSTREKMEFMKNEVRQYCARNLQIVDLETDSREEFYSID